MCCKSPACLIGFGMTNSTTQEPKCYSQKTVQNDYVWFHHGFLFFCVQESYSELVTTSLIALMVIMCTYKISSSFL